MGIYQKQVAMTNRVHQLFEHAYANYAQAALENSEKIPSRGKFIKALVDNWERKEVIEQ